MKLGLGLDQMAICLRAASITGEGVAGPKQVREVKVIMLRH